MNRLETYQSDAVERPLFRKRLVAAFIVSILLHVALVYWFQQTPVATFDTSASRLKPLRVFNTRPVTIDEKLLDGSDKAAQPVKKVEDKPALKPLDLPDEKPMAEVTQGKLAPVAPTTHDFVKPITNDKPTVDPDEAKTIARVQANAAQSMLQDLDAVRDSILKDQPPNAGDGSLKLPDTHSADSAKTDALGMAAASGRLDKLLSHGLHSGDAPVTMPGGALFGFDKADLLTGAIEQLHQLGTLIKRSPDVIFTIEGYTDSFGDPAYNLQLSQARADAVRSWLIQNMDVDPARIKATGYGATSFLTKPRTVDMHSQAAIDAEETYEQGNRRVEIKFAFPAAQ